MSELEEDWHGHVEYEDDIKTLYRTLERFGKRLAAVEKLADELNKLRGRIATLERIVIEREL